VAALAFALAGCGNSAEEGGVELNLPKSDLTAYGIEEPHRFYDLSMLDVMDLVTNEAFDGVLYFGFAECPWCQESVPVLQEASQNTEVDILYVSRAHVLREGEWVDADIEMAWWFDGQVGLEWLVDEEGEPTRPNIFVPFVVHVSGGEVVSAHRGTIWSDAEDGYLLELSPEQRADLLSLYEGLLTDSCPADALMCA